MPGEEAVRMELWIKNGTADTLTGLRVQNCVMLKGLRGFDSQTDENKRLGDPWVACHNAEQDRWVITGWQRCVNPWANAPCPCLHSDPQFEDCPPGETRRLKGWFSFYEGRDIEREIARLENLLE